MSAVVKAYLKLLGDSWTAATPPATRQQLTATFGRSQLELRINDYDLSGITGKWLRTTPKLIWRSVRDPQTGHTIHVVSDRGSKQIDADLLLGLRILKWMSIKRAITWFWWDHDRPRILPPFTSPGQKHLNGGWTSLDTSRDPEVHVYRREEAHKVLIHECIHALALDVPANSLLESQRTLIERSLGGYRLYPHFGEAYTEFYAEFLWAGIQGQGLKAWNRQIACSAGQAREVWGRIAASGHHTENTSVFAYYVMKWVLMLHVDHLLLDPRGSVKFWAAWWDSARGELDAAKKNVRMDKPFFMGMTCGLT